VQGQASVSFAQDRIEHQRFLDCRLEVVGDDPARHAAKALEGALVEGQPGGHFLVKDDLGVLVSAVAQGGHEDICPPEFAADRVKQPADVTEVDLQLLTGRGVDAHHRLRRVGRQLIDEAAHGRVATPVAIVVTQLLVDGGHLDALIDQALHQVTVRLDTGRLARRLRVWPEDGAQSGGIRHRAIRLQVAVLGCQDPILMHSRARQAQVFGDATLALAGSQSMDQVKQVVHVKSLHGVCSSSW
jgi:hypothetical protein